MRRSRRRQRLALTLLLLACVSMVIVDDGGRLAGLHRAASSAFGPVERSFFAVSQPMGRFLRGLPDIEGDRRRITALTIENSKLRSQLRSVALSSAELAQLHAIGASADAAGYSVHAASVVDYGPSPGFEWTVRINVGSGDGVRTGMTVLAPEGLVGRVSQVASDTSLVVLAVDPGSSVGIRDRRSGELALATGDGLEPMRYVPLDPHSPPRAGDVVVTGPYGRSTYTAGVPVGTVSAVTSVGATSTPRVSVRPYVDFSRLDIVAVVLDRAPEPAKAGAAATVTR